LFGLHCLWIAWRSANLISEWPVMILSLAAAIGWPVITSVFMEYWRPKVNVAVFAVLIAAAATA
jgi:hypothetical protein